jgi:hypothetical protein
LSGVNVVSSIDSLALILCRQPVKRPPETCVCVYYCRTYYKAVCGGGRGTVEDIGSGGSNDAGGKEGKIYYLLFIIYYLLFNST